MTIETLAITDAITKLSDIRDRFHLVQELSPDFFPESSQNLPELTPAEQVELEHLKDRYLYYVEDGEISEGTVNIIMISPLLNLLGLCDPPYRIRGEKWVRVRVRTDTEQGELILEGRMDALSIQEQFWLVVVEGKRGGFSVLQALPQTLAYMMGNPHPERPIFGLATNGYDFIFIKLNQQDPPRYGLSHNFTLLSDSANNLQRVAKIIKRLTSNL